MTGIIRAQYEIHGDDVDARARALAVELSHELPTELAPERSHVSLAHVVDRRQNANGVGVVTIEFPELLAGGELPQLLVLLLGNGSLNEGVRLIDVDLPDSLGAAIGGPQLGVAGVRRILNTPERPLLATAIKPVGLEADGLAALAHEFALGGIDLIKDDQGLANQVWAPFEERVEKCAAAVARANELTGGRSRYLAAINTTADRFDERVRFAVDAGAGGVLVMPGISGFDALRRARDLLPDDGVVLSHPSFLGGFTSSPTHGIAPDALLGLLSRLAGADVVVYPHAGGRFGWSVEQCRSIGQFARRPFAGLLPTLPAPGGGMTLERVPELVELYGPDVVLLVGADLQRGGDARRASEAFAAAARAAIGG